MLFIPLGRRAKYQGKIAKMEYKDAKHARTAQKHAANRAAWQAMSPRTRAFVIVSIAVFVVICMIAGH